MVHWVICTYVVFIRFCFRDSDQKICLTTVDWVNVGLAYKTHWFVIYTGVFN